MLEIKYGPLINNRITLFPASSSDKPLVVFIHGGAWRDGAVENHFPFAQALSKHPATPCSVALLCYRLSTPEKGSAVHPNHLQDVYDGLHHLLFTERPESVKNCGKIIVVGHSVGAWFASAICLKSSIPIVQEKSGMPFLRNVHNIRSVVSAWVFLDGIYDIDRMLVEYPSYAEFVEQAFQRPPSASYVDVSLPSFSLDITDTFPRVYIVHSRNDELLSYRQSLIANYHVLSLIKSHEPEILEKCAVIAVPVPTFDETKAISGISFVENDPSLLPVPSFLNVSDNKKHFSYSLTPYCNVDFLKLSGSHDGMLQGNEFVEYIANLVERLDDK